MDTMDIVVTIICSISSVLVALGTIHGYVKKALNKLIEDGVDEKISQATSDINNDLELSMVSLETSIESLSDQLKEMHDEMRDIKRIQKDTTQSNARYVINEAHKAYIKQGWIDNFTLASLEDIFQTYSETGGNHFTADHMQDLRDLPNEKPVKKAPAKKTPTKKTTKTKDNIGGIVI